MRFEIAANRWRFELLRTIRDKFPQRGFCTSGSEFWETNFGRPDLGAEFLGRMLCSLNFFQRRRPPEKKVTLEKFTSQISLLKIQPRSRAKKFTMHLCRHVAVIQCVRGERQRGGAILLHVCGSPDAFLENPNLLNQEVRPFFLCGNSIWSSPPVSSLSDYSMWRS